MKNKSVQNETLSMKTIISIGILMGFAILTGVIIINMVTGSENNIEVTNQWVEAYKKVESSRVGIIFNAIDTQDSEYTTLRQACNSFREQVAVNPDIKVRVDTIVNEEKFVDTTPGTKQLEIGSKSMVETGPIYFQNMLMIRYINETGELKVLTALQDAKQENKIKVVNQSELKEYINQTIKTQATKATTTNTNIITEESYLYIIGITVIQLLQANTEDKINSAEEMAIKYFTIDGAETVSSDKEIMAINDASIVSVNYAVAGKSDTALNNKDRVYMQIKVGDEGKERLIDIVLKLNSNLKIFDIDVI